MLQLLRSIGFFANYREGSPMTGSG